MRYFFQQMLKVSAFYLEKQKFYPQKKKFKPSLNMPRWIQKMALAVLIFSEGFGTAYQNVNTFTSIWNLNFCNRRYVSSSLFSILRGWHWRPDFIHWLKFLCEREFRLFDIYKLNTMSIVVKITDFHLSLLFKSSSDAWQRCRL